MSLVVNHNLMAMNTARHLNGHYGNLSTSTQRLASGLRINSAADDAAGLAIRELMRADITTLNQGVRNANDAISLIQTADGAMSVIDEKLIRMKELAEQAATGTYNSTQRLIIDSEFQAMGAEIDRIAQSTDFNGIKLLNGSRAFEHDGSGLESTGALKIHFGTGNDSDEDYYYIDLAQAGMSGLLGNAGLRGLGLAVGEGRWWDEAVIDYKNRTLVLDIADRAAGLDDGSPQGVKGLDGIDLYKLPVGLKNITITSAATAHGAHKPHVNLFDKSGKQITGVNPDTRWHNIKGSAWWNGKSGDKVVKAGISNGIFDPNAVYDGNSIIGSQAGQTANAAGTNITIDTPQNEIKSGTGNDEIMRIDAVTDDLVFLIGGHSRGSVVCNHYRLKITAEFDDRFVKHFYGDSGGASDIQTQKRAQMMLSRIDNAVVKKDNIRAHLGALQNRLENTVTNLQTQAENLQASESRISDVDVATEMTNLVRNQILAQSAVSMLSQANSLTRTALNLIGG